MVNQILTTSYDLINTDLLFYENLQKLGKGNALFEHSYSDMLIFKRKYENILRENITEMLYVKINNKLNYNQKIDV